MNRPVVVVLAALAAIGSWYFFSQLPVDSRSAGPFPTGTATPVPGSDVPALPGLGQTIRIATFNLGVYGPAKVSDAAAMEVLARIVRNFDVIAVQEVRSRDQSALPALVDLVNAAGRRYDYVTSPRLGRTDQKEQFAYIFDTRTVAVDRQQLYTLNDPDDLLHREPFVAMFRVQGPAPQQAFTFTLVNMHIDPDLIEQENALLPRIVHEVRNDGRHEDDVIVLGDFNTSSIELTRIMMAPADLIWALPSDTPTNTRGDAQYDNIFFSRQFTDEFTGRAGVFDFLRQYNLTMDQAIRVSDHMPVWAEFRVREGAEPGRLAQQPVTVR